MTPDQATLILNSVGLPSLHAEHPVTKKVIAAIPADKVDYRPDPIARSAIDLAWHIVTAENRFLEAALAGAFDLTPRPRRQIERARQGGLEKAVLGGDDVPGKIDGAARDRVRTIVDLVRGNRGDDLLGHRVLGVRRRQAHGVENEGGLIGCHGSLLEQTHLAGARRA